MQTRHYLLTNLHKFTEHGSEYWINPDTFLVVHERNWLASALGYLLKAI